MDKCHPSSQGVQNMDGLGRQPSETKSFIIPALSMTRGDREIAPIRPSHSYFLVTSTTLSTFYHNEDKDDNYGFRILIFEHFCM